MKYFSLVIPLLFLAVTLYAMKKRVKPYDTYVEGAKQALPLVCSLFPYLAVTLILGELFEKSGLSAALTQWLSPFFSALGIPPEISPLVLMKPFSGSGATAILSNILSTFGADSYIGRCASVCYGSSETVFYISAVYFAVLRGKKPVKPIIISLAVNFITVIFSCFLCRFL